MTSFTSHKHFLILPREGDNISDISNDEQYLTLGELCMGLNESSTQLDYLKKIGISFSENDMLLTFKEKGNAYADPKGDRTRKEDTPSTESFSLKLPLNSHLNPPIAIKLNLDPFIEDGVNFLGNVNIKTSQGKEKSIPLTGTGTVALEGKPDDCHAGYCTGPACASFQERVAIILGICECVGVREENMELLFLRLKKVNYKYHGRNDILDYTIERATSDSKISYFEFMKLRYNGSESTPPMLAAFIDDQPPLDGYYEKLKQRFDPDTIHRQKVEWEESQKSTGSYFSVFSKSPYGAFVVCGTVATAVCIYLFRRSK